jgi:hypothetical protein
MADSMDVFNPQAYGPNFAPLLETDRRRPLDAGKPDAAAATRLKKLSIDAAFAHVRSQASSTRPLDMELARCCVAGVWLLHDYLDESHTVSQRIDSPSGSFWHAIMHRREGDFSNAKYWFRNVGQHPTVAALGERAVELAANRADDSLLGKLVESGDWDPFAFVELCQAVESGQTAAREFCLDVQQAEWELLFDHCYREAVGK